MIKYYIILTIAFAPFSLMSQINCVDFKSYESSQNWINELNKLDDNIRKDSILNRIKCERFFKKQNVEYEYTLFWLFNGLPITFIPEYRDSLLCYIKAQNIILLNSLCEYLYPDKCYLGMVIIDELNKPIIDNIDALTILKVERKTKYHKRKRTIKESKIIIKFKSDKTQEFMFKIEDFSNIDNYKTERLHIKKGTRTIDFSVDREIKVISIIDSENNSTIIIN